MARKNSEGICNCKFMCTYALILAFYFISNAERSLGYLPPVDFNYTSFESAEGIKILGNASAVNKILELTVGGLQHSVGRALRSEAIKMYDRSTGLALSFSTAFTFTVKIDNLSAYGDGFTFGFFPDKKIPQNSSGGSLGLYDPESTAKNHVVAVEFDLFKNEFDPDSNHVGLDLNNVTSATSSLLLNYGVRLKAGIPINVQIDYDGSTGRLDMYTINASLGNPLKNLVLSSFLNLSRFIPYEEVFVGFSAATGNYAEYHSIHSWSFWTWKDGASGVKGSDVMPTSLVRMLVIVLDPDF